MALPRDAIYCVKCDRIHAASHDCFPGMTEGSERRPFFMASVWRGKLAYLRAQEQAVISASQRAAEESPWRWLFEQAKKNDQQAAADPIKSGGSIRPDIFNEAEFRPNFVRGEFYPYKAMSEEVERKCAAAVGVAAKNFLPAAPSAPAASLPSFDVDHAWDMIVLAARTSRYEG